MQDMLYEKIAKPLLFKMDPEKAHHLTIDGLKRAQRIPGLLAMLRASYESPAAPELRQTIWNITFPNPIGLAAGLDKNGEAAGAFSHMGFGFIEVGTVTPRPQPGNEQPRLFRLPEDEALINRMGFNNHGAEAMLSNLMSLGKRPIPIAVNIGKNKTTPNDEAVQDYRTCMRILYDVGDYFVVNISSPNTPNLRNLQHGDDLSVLLSGVIAERDQQAAERKAAPKPVLVKIAPDMSEEELAGCVQIIMSSGISGIIATNTTITRPNLRSKHREETGGLSGRPLNRLSVGVVRQVYRLTEGRIPIVASGGVFTGDDAYEMIRAGANLVEIYTGMIYQGPGVNRSINRRLLERLRQDGYEHISQAVGADA
jgi:dihydroorotate dehydrogenase